MKLQKKIKRTVETICWFAMIRLLKIWSTCYMDQWEKVKFETEYGTIYVTISRHDQWPDSFDQV